MRACTHIHIHAYTHTNLAWEEDNCIRIYGAAKPKVNLDFLDKETSGGHLHVWRLDVHKGQCVEDRDVDTKNLVDFMQVSPPLIGQKTRYVYATHFVDSYKSNGIVKFDLEKETFVRHRFDSGKVDEGQADGGVYGGENMFAIRGTDGEDDGWLIGYTVGDTRCPSAVDIVDARSMERVARVALPQRVPVGFHAFWKSAL